jgi:hypothetical protein
MNWEYKILTERNLVSVRGAGKFSPVLFEEMIKDIQSNEQWRPNMDRLIDFNTVDFTETTPADIKAAAEIHKRYDSRIGQGRIAVVFGKEADLGLGRMYETFLGSDVAATVKSFRTADEARQWLAQEMPLRQK